MIDLYKYISEGLLSGQEATLSTGTNDSDSILIEEWLNENNEYVHVDNISNCLTADNKINARSFNPWYAYGTKELRLPAPDYIKFGKVGHVSMTMQHDVYFSELPHIDKCNELLLKPFADGLKLDLSLLPIDKVNVFEWVYDRNNISKFPKKTEIDTFIMWSNALPSSVFGHPQYMIGFDKIKGLKCNKLAIPDIIFAEKYSDFNTGYNSMIRTGAVSFESQPGQMLLKLFDDKSIQFNKLYVYSTCANNYKFYELKKGKDSFAIAKRGTTLMK